MPKEYKISTIKELKELLNTLDENARVVTLLVEDGNIHHAEAHYEINDAGELAIYSGDALDF